MKRIEREKKTVAMMIDMYCRRHHGNGSMCRSCRELLEYACSRLDHCPQGDRKGSCRRCHHHCYRAGMAADMRRVMRYSGPRMMFCHPVAALRHLLCELTSR